MRYFLVRNLIQVFNKLYFYYICICNIIPQEINIILLIEKNNNYQHSNKT